MQGPNQSWWGSGPCREPAGSRRPCLLCVWCVLPDLRMPHQHATPSNFVIAAPQQPAPASASSVAAHEHGCSPATGTRQLCAEISLMAQLDSVLNLSTPNLCPHGVCQALHCVTRHLHPGCCADDAGGRSTAATGTHASSSGSTRDFRISDNPRPRSATVSPSSAEHSPRSAEHGTQQPADGAAPGHHHGGLLRGGGQGAAVRAAGGLCHHAQRHLG